MQQAAVRFSEELLDEMPATWTGPHVGRRLCEAMQTLALLPMGKAAPVLGWPAYCYEWDDLLAQQAARRAGANPAAAEPHPAAAISRERAATWRTRSAGPPNIWPGFPICCAPSTRWRSRIRSIATPAGWRSSAAAMPTHGGSATTPAARSSRKACVRTACRCSSHGRSREPNDLLALRRQPAASARRSAGWLMRRRWLNVVSDTRHSTGQAILVFK